MSKVDKAKKLVDSKNYNKAIGLLRSELKLNPNNFQALKLIGDCFHNQNKIKRMISFYKRAQKIKPDFGLDLASITHGMNEKLNSAPDSTTDVIDLINTGIVAYSNDDYNAAIQKFEAASRLDATCAKAWFNLGTIFNKQKEWIKAIKSLSKAVQFDSEEKDYWYNLGFARYHAKEYDLALCALNETLELDWHHANANYYSALIYTELKNQERVIFHLKRMLTISPNWKSFVLEHFADFGFKRVKDLKKALD